MEIVECTGLEIPLELCRIVQLPTEQQPYSYVHASNPKYKGGVNYEGLKLICLSTGFESDGTISQIICSFSQMELGYRSFVWTPEGVEKKPDDLEILKLTIYSYGESQRSALRKGRFEQFVSQLPTPLTSADLRVIEYQRWLESTLPQLPRELNRTRF